VSYDGRVIVGTGFNPSGAREAWIATLGADCPGDLNSDSVVDIGDLATLIANFGDTSAAPEDGDLDDDGDVDIADLALMVNRFGESCL
jgi:hypothetical protein